MQQLGLYIPLFVFLYFFLNFSKRFNEKYKRYWVSHKIRSCCGPIICQ